MLRFAALRVARCLLPVAPALRAGEDLRAELEDFFALAFLLAERVEDFFAADFFFAPARFEEEAAFRAPLGDFAARRLEDFFEDEAAFFAPPGDFAARRLEVFFEEDFLEEARAVLRFTSLLNRLPFSSARSIASPLRSNHSKNSSHSIASSVSSPL